MANLGNQTSNYVTCFPGAKAMGYYINRNHAINYISFAFVNSVTSLSGIFLNLTFIIAVLKTKALQTIPNVILIVLSLNDLFMASTAMPILVYINADLAFGKSHCSLLLTDLILIHSSMNISYVLITVISVERYVAVVHPFWYDFNLSKTKVVCLTVGLSIGMLITTVVCLGLQLIMIYNIAQSVIIFIAYVVFLFCQIRVFMVVHKIRRRIANDQTASKDKSNLAESKNKAYALLYIALSFVLCYLSFAAFQFDVYANGYSQVGWQYVLPWLTTLAFLSPLFSPIVYYWRLKDVRKAAKKLFFSSQN